MNQAHGGVPIACNPHAVSAEGWATHQQRSEQLFKHHVEATHELNNGYAFHFPAEVFQSVAAFVDGERRCCPFFTFTITVPPASDTLTLEITGTPQAKALLAQELGHSLTTSPDIG